MKVFNVIIVFDRAKENALMCLRSKEPYLGLYNFPGGKAEPGEDGLSAAYRELYEETGVSMEDITLSPLMEFRYPLEGCVVEAYAGRLKGAPELREEAHKLSWHSLDRNFFDMNVYAGEGNIGHMLEIIKLYPGVME